MIILVDGNRFHEGDVFVEDGYWVKLFQKISDKNFAVEYLPIYHIDPTAVLGVFILRYLISGFLKHNFR